MAKGGHGSKAGGNVKLGTPAMREAWRLLEAGDVKAARRAAQGVLAGTPSPEDTAEATDLLQRSGFPIEALKVAALAATLIIILLVVAVLRG